MTHLLEGLRQALADPVTRHAMLVHLPIAGVFFALPFAITLLAIPHRPARAFRGILAGSLFLLGVVAWQAGEAGEAAFPIVEARLLDDESRQVLKQHAAWGETVASLIAITSGLVACTLIPRRGVRIAAAIASVAGMIGVCGVVIATAHDGGRLVHWLDPGPRGSMISPTR